MLLRKMGCTCTLGTGSLYTGLLLSGKLHTHLNEIDAAAPAEIELLTKQMAQQQGITEELVFVPYQSVPL